MTESLENPNKFNRVNIITKEKNSEEPNWYAFDRAQEPHKKLFREMIAQWENEYCYSPNLKIRRQAGKNLGYGEIRMAVHEYVIPLYWFRGKLL